MHISGQLDYMMIKVFLYTYVYQTNDKKTLDEEVKKSKFTSAFTSGVVSSGFYEKLKRQLSILGIDLNICWDCIQVKKKHVSQSIQRGVSLLPGHKASTCR